MTFTATYRDATGAMREERVEAASRSEAMAKLKARGITPIRVDEHGSAISTGAEGATSLVSSGNIKAVVAIMAILAVGGLWWWFGNGKDTDPKRGGGRNGKSVALPPKSGAEGNGGDIGVPKHVMPSPVVAPVTNTAPMVLEPRTNWPYMWLGKAVVSIDKCYTNMGKEVNYFTTSDGKRHCFERLAYTPIFETATDDLISQAVNADPTMPMPPMPSMQGLDREFLASLSKPITINPDDSEQVRKAKEAVIQARKDMKRMMDGGMTFSEVLQEHRKIANENFETRRQLAADVRQLVDAGEGDEAKRYLDKVNPALEEMGLAPLEMPLSHEELMERRRENRRRAQEKAEASGK